MGPRGAIVDVAVPHGAAMHWSRRRDRNFPVSSLGVPVIRLYGASVTRALDAVLSVLPLDDFVPEATWGMQVVDQADKKIPIFAEFRESIARRAGPHVAAQRVDAEINHDRGAPCFRDSRSQISKLLALGVGGADDENAVPP
jgi:L-fucose mutarotase/ribose pyranase (RbsD/FucU family)